MNIWKIVEDDFFHILTKISFYQLLFSWFYDINLHSYYSELIQWLTELLKLNLKLNHLDTCITWYTEVHTYAYIYIDIYTYICMCRNGDIGTEKTSNHQIWKKPSIFDSFISWQLEFKMDFNLNGHGFIIKMDPLMKHSHLSIVACQLMSKQNGMLSRFNSLASTLEA